MFYTNLDLFKTQQDVLHRQAAEYRLIRTLVNQPYWLRTGMKSSGQIMIVSGQYLLNRTQGVH